MTVRYNADVVDGVFSGYEGTPVYDEDANLVPSCTLEDVDVALFNAFDKQINFSVKQKDGTKKKVPVIFAAGERFALVKKRKMIRDKNGLIILPLISIRRTGVSQTNQDITSRGINQHTGDLVIKRRLAPEDRAYQRIVNKLGIKNQDNIAISTTAEPSGSVQLRTERTIGADEFSVTTLDSAHMAPSISRNIFECIVIPQQQFYTAAYELVIAMQYTTDMNNVLQQMVSAYLQQGRRIRIESDKGYWFVAKFDETYTSVDNTEDFTEKERVIMTTVNITVPAYFIPGKDAGNEQPVRRYVSMPEINFSVQFDEDIVDDQYANADDPTKNILLNDIGAQQTLDSTATARNNGTTHKTLIRNPFSTRPSNQYLKKISYDINTGESVFRET